MADPITGNSTTPARQAYASVTTQGYKGRLPSTAGNIRLVKSNPYIMHLPKEELDELNSHLLTPYQGEIFYDDEGYQYYCDVIVDPLTQEYTYNYISKEKQLAEKLRYYETSGVMNQLMSAYNNGRVFNFYYNRGTQMMYPNTSLVFPEDFAYYTVRSQKLNDNGEYIYLAGSLQLDNNTGTYKVIDNKISMQYFKDTMTGNNYTRMNPSRIFVTDMDNPHVGYENIVDGQFYVVDFFNADNILIDTKLFQAINCAISNTKTPSQSITDLIVTVLRNGVTHDISGENVYPIEQGENITDTISFVVTAVYSDGTHVIITDKLDGPNLSRTGWFIDTSAAAVGDEFEIKFTYYPIIDEYGNPIGTSITKNVKFKIVQQTENTIVKLLPVAWTEMSASEIADTNRVKVYKFKLYSLDKAGVLENKTIDFYNTMRVISNTTGTEIEWQEDSTNSTIAYDPFSQSMIFFFNDGSMFSTTKRVTFKISNVTYKIILAFDKLESSKGLFVKPMLGIADFGYEQNGPLIELRETYGTYDNDQKLNNRITLTRGTNGWEFDLSYKVAFTQRYTRVVEGKTIVPNNVQLFAVKDATVTPLTSLIPFSTSATQCKCNIYKDSNVQNIVQNIQEYEYILVKFFSEIDGITSLVNIDLYNVKKNLIMP